MGWISDSAEEVYKLQASELLHTKRELNLLTRKWEEVGLLVLGAARQGFTNEEQRQAFFFALEKLTGEPYIVLRLIIDVPPKEYPRDGNYYDPS